ncbi:AAA family ATPase [Streptomyces uncialis]|uniref:AAA family ATPase n=1 Tax=Streptomyces uncialis TaxID=1048205 RepID=UPI00386B685D
MRATEGGFLLGPPGTGRTSFAKALAVRRSVPIDVSARVAAVMESGFALYAS